MDYGAVKHEHNMSTVHFEKMLDTGARRVSEKQNAAAVAAAAEVGAALQ